MRAIPLMLALGLVAGFSGVASAGDSPWALKIGASQVDPKSDSGMAGMEISSEVGFTPAIEYKFTDNIVGEVLLAIPFEHEIEAGGATAVTFKHLPPTFSAKYLFSPGATFSPYVGLGLNYTLVFDETHVAGADVDAGDSVGLAANVGVEYRVPGSKWGVALDVRYIKIESDVDVNGAKAGTLEVDPTVVGLSAVYHY